MSEAPTDWEQQTTAALKLRIELGDAEAMRLLALPHAQLWACSTRSAHRKQVANGGRGTGAGLCEERADLGAAVRGTSARGFLFKAFGGF